MSPAPVLPATRPSVFIVDDTPTNIQVLISLLEDECELRFATSGPDALEMLRQEPLPDLLLLDVMMPGMDGYEVFEALKANPATRSLPVLFVTAKTDPASESRAFAAGAVDFIHKPFNHDVVRARVRLQLQLQAAHRELQRHRDHLEELVEARTRELAAARDAAESANRAKSAFLANMSHELRTPLNHILGFASLLEDMVHEPDSQAMLRGILQSGQHLLVLVRSVLDLSRAEADQITLAEIDFDLAGLLEHTLAQVREAAAAKGLSLRLEHDAALPERLRGDPVRLGQVVGALLDNAVKFSRSGDVVLRTCCQAQHPHAVTLRIEVQDHGMGIAPEVQQQLFERFHQGDNSLTRAHGGLGLGLALSQRLARLMNAQMDWQTQPGQGSRFALTLRLPLAHPPASAPAPNNGPADLGTARETAHYLATLLREGDAHALDLWQQSRSALYGLLGDLAPAFEQSLHTYDFDDALKRLTRALTPAEAAPTH